MPNQISPSIPHYVCKHCKLLTFNPNLICEDCYEIIADETLDELLLTPDTQLGDLTLSQLIDENYENSYFLFR